MVYLVEMNQLLVYQRYSEETQQSQSQMICRFRVSNWFNFLPYTCFSPTFPPLLEVKFTCRSVLFLERLRLYWKNLVNGLFRFQCMVLNYSCFLFPINADTSNFIYLLWQVVLQFISMGYISRCGFLPFICIHQFVRVLQNLQFVAAEVEVELVVFWDREFYRFLRLVDYVLSFLLGSQVQLTQN